MIEDRSPLQPLAAAVADGDSIDWEAVRRSGGVDGSDQFLRLARLFGTVVPRRVQTPPATYRPAWIALLETIATLQVLTGLAACLLTPGDGRPVPAGLAAGLMTVFAVTGLFLQVGGRHDLRARDLGGFFLVAAAAFSHRFLAETPVLPPLTRLLRALPIDSFLPLLLWRFLREFPRGVRFSRGDVLVAFFVRASLVMGAGLLAVQVLLAAVPPLRSYPLAALARGHESGAYWGAIFALCLPALLAAPWRASAAQPQERRRVLLLLAGITLGAAPIAVNILVEVLFPLVSRRLDHPTTRHAASIVVFLFLLVVPASATYAVMVERVLDVRVAARLAVRYLLARFTLVALALLPAAALAAYLYAHRHETLASITGRPTAVALAATAGVGLFLIRSRDLLLRRFDHAFFPRRAIAPSGFSSLPEAARTSRSVAELAQLIAEEVAHAVAVESVSVLIASGDGRQLVPVAGPARPMEAQSAVVTLLLDDPSALSVDPSDGRSVFALLPEEERQWVVDGNVALVLPLAPASVSLAGLICVGPKLSELGFSREDQLLLSSLAVSATLALETGRAREGDDKAAGPRAGWMERPASLCTSCGRVYPPAQERCECGERPSVAPVPYLLAGKFRMEALLGRGGMGVVLRATDVDLGRRVAVKALPRVSAEAALRLRREARAMAAVTHPHLALIYGAESWRGTPLLVVEHLSGGTLAERLRAGPLSVETVLRLGLDLAGALDRLHRAGLLHRDVKPSNIGFADDGSPKLLDFGLARWRDVAAGEPTPPPGREHLEADGSLTDSRWIVGTPLYMSPEALAGGRITEPAADVWALSVVLFECLAGVHPFRSATLAESIGRIRRGEAASLRKLRPECPLDVSRVIQEALSPSREHRPSTAVELHRRLGSLTATHGGARPDPASGTFH